MSAIPSSFAPTPKSTGSSSAFGDLSSDQFIKVLISELANQDPFQPQDSSAMLEQLSSLRNIESQMSLQTSIGSLVQQNQLAASGGMIGKRIEGVDVTGQRLEGVVRAVHVHDGNVQLELEKGGLVNMNQVTRMVQDGLELVGKGVEAVRDNGDVVTGTVRAVRSMGGLTMLELNDGTTVPMSQVRRIFDPGERTV